MRRLLLAALSIALIVGASAGAASARFTTDGSRTATWAAAPFHAPATLPRPDASQPGAYVFRPAAAIAAGLQRGAGSRAPAAAHAGGASATVSVTATVLPVVIIVLDDSGQVVELFTNTEQRSATGVVYLVRHAEPDGPRAALTADAWASARAALRRAAAGTGTIWSS